MTTTYPHLLDRFQRVLVLAGAAVVCYIVAVLAVTSALGGFLVPALAGGVMFAVVIAAINKRTPPPSASPDAFADLALTTGMLNFAQVRGAGAGSGARVSARRPDGLTPTACGRRRAAGSPR